MWIAIHKAPDRTTSPCQGGPHTRDKSVSAGNKLGSLIAQSFKPLTFKDHVVLIINSTGKRGTVSSTAARACALLPRQAMWEGASSKFHPQVVAAESKPGHLLDLLAVLLAQAQVCRPLTRLSGFETCKVGEVLPTNPLRELGSAN